MGLKNLAPGVGEGLIDRGLSRPFVGLLGKSLAVASLMIAASLSAKAADFGDPLYTFRPVGNDGLRASAGQASVPAAVQTAFFGTPSYPPEERFTPVAATDTDSGRQAGAASESALSPQRTRFYLGALVGAQALLDTSFAPGLELSDSQLALSGVVGVNIGRYFGVELAADFAEADLDAPGIGTVAEFSQVNLIPQLRLRYPFLNDRMTAYLTGGVGFGQTEVNDKTPAAATPGAPSVTGSDSDTSPVYVFGGGLEYYYADNIVLTLDAKYTHQSAEVEVDGVNNEIDLDAFRVLAGTRLLFPGPAHRPRGGGGGGTGAPSPLFGYDARYARPYANFQIGPPGAAIILDEDIDSDFSFGGRQSLVLGGGFGYDLNRYLGFEVAANWHEQGIEAFRADFNTDSAVVEYGLWTLVPQIRLRYPLVNERLVPYVVAGVGVGYTETNDTADEIGRLEVPRVDGEDFGLAVAFGAGLEFLVAENMALGGEVKYIYHRPELEIGGRAVEIDADAVLGTLGVRVYF